jgi:hypothetical protein
VTTSFAVSLDGLSHFIHERVYNTLRSRLHERIVKKVDEAEQAGPAVENLEAVPVVEKPVTIQ